MLLRSSFGRFIRARAGLCVSFDLAHELGPILLQLMLHLGHGLGSGPLGHLETRGPRILGSLHQSRQFASDWQAPGQVPNPGARVWRECRASQPTTRVKKALGGKGFQGPRAPAIRPALCPQAPA